MTDPAGPHPDGPHPDSSHTDSSHTDSSGPEGSGHPEPDYDEHGTPSLDHVRDKIEGRYATSLGATELAEDTAPARVQAEQMADREKKAAERLEQIRRSLG